MQMCSDVKALSLSMQEGALFVGCSSVARRQPQVMKVSLHCLDSTRCTSLPGTDCWSIDTHGAPGSIGAPSGRLAAACGSAAAVMHIASDHVVSTIPTSGLHSCKAVAWRSEHQLWASDSKTLKLWDLRRLSQSVGSYAVDDTPVLSICAMGEECVVVGTQRGSYAVACQPDGSGVLLTPPSVAGPCASVAVAPASDHRSAAVVTTYQGASVRSATASGDAAHCVVSRLSKRVPVPPRNAWAAQSMCTVPAPAPQGVRARCEVLRLSSTTVLCGADAMGGAVRVWDVGLQAAPQQPRVLGDLASTGERQAAGAALLCVQQVTAALGEHGSWAVAAVRVRAHNPAPMLTLYKVGTCRGS